MSRDNPSTAILDALGIEWKGQNITHAVIELKGPDEFPTATITRLVLGTTPNTRKFNWVLTSTDPIRFDIEAACDAARAAVAATIERSTRRAHNEIREAFLDATLATKNQEAKRIKPPCPELASEITFAVDYSPSRIKTTLAQLTGIGTGIAVGLAICGIRRSA